MNGGKHNAPAPLTSARRIAALLGLSRARINHYIDDANAIIREVHAGFRTRTKRGEKPAR